MRLTLNNYWNYRDYCRMSEQINLPILKHRPGISLICKSQRKEMQGVKEIEKGYSDSEGILKFLYMEKTCGKGNYKTSN